MFDLAVSEALLLASCSVFEDARAITMQYEKKIAADFFVASCSFNIHLEFEGVLRMGCNS